MAEINTFISDAELADALSQSQEGMVSVEIKGHVCQDLWAIGSRAWFEYHCNESEDSGDALAWYHSHQQVQVIGVGGGEPITFTTHEERANYAMVLVYQVRFDDGLIWNVFEDELMADPEEFYADDPPAMPERFLKSLQEHIEKDKKWPSK